MMTNRKYSTALLIGLRGAIAASSFTTAAAQVNPSEMLNARSRTNEQKYLQQLVSLKQAIDTARFPMRFRLARYLDAKAGQAALDTNGIEFVSFQNRSVLKISGFYDAAFDSKRLNENARVVRTFEGAVVPILREVARNLPRTVECDGIGFEVLYGTRDAGREFEFEGREVLSIVLSRDDAFAFAQAADRATEQEILDRSDIYVNGTPFMLKLDEVPLGQREMGRKPVLTTVAAIADVPHEAHAAEPGATDEVPSSVPLTNSKADQVIRLQQQFGAKAKSAIDAESGRLHPDSERVPQFESDDQQIWLHFTLKNSLSFEEDTSSIYKRAARSFDLFLAPELKDLLANLPEISELDAFQFSVRNSLNSNRGEVVEYFCPVKALHEFVQNRITSQELIDQSTVLVNGVRIGINLQLVE